MRQPSIIITLTARGAHLSAEHICLGSVHKIASAIHWNRPINTSTFACSAPTNVRHVSERPLDGFFEICLFAFWI